MISIPENFTIRIEDPFTVVLMTVLICFTAIYCKSSEEAKTGLLFGMFFLGFPILVFLVLKYR